MIAEPHEDSDPDTTGIRLYWIPLGAGGVGFVRLDGRLYEWATARRENRQPRSLYHAALEVRTPAGRFVVENAWPSPDANSASRGVVVEGPVFSRRLARLRPFRYEVRCWQDGVIPDIDEAEQSPQHLTDNQDQAQRLLDLTTEVPALVWGRDEEGTGEMWNSNSVISWLLTRAGLAVDSVQTPAGGRAPGWVAGVHVARQDHGGAHRTEPPL